MKGNVRKSRQNWLVLLCVAFLVACGTDGGDDAEDLGPDVEQSDAGDENDASDVEEEEPDPTIWVDGDISTRESCDEVCAAEGLECDRSFEHPVFGNVGMTHAYGEDESDALYGGGACDEAPEAFIYDPFIDRDSPLLSYRCRCVESF